MAGKRNRKRQTASKKKASKEKTNEEIAVREEKKPKLDDELEEQQTKEPEKLAQQPNVETTCTMQVAETNDVSSDLKTAEENKYVPPFTRKPKRTLQRDRSLVSPDVKTTRPKRRWKERKENSQEDQQISGDQQTNDMTNTKDSPKVRLNILYTQIV